MSLKKISKQVKNKMFPTMNQKIRFHYAENYETAVIDKNTILYETRDGKSIVDSPYAMFIHMSGDSKYRQYKHVWVIDINSEGIEDSIPSELRRNVTFVHRNTIEHVDYLLKSKYIITNSTLESFFVKRPGQVYINTWHGTPLKYMGYDLKQNMNHSQNVLRNFLMTDFILSPNEHTSNIFTDSYKLRDAYTGKILESGYPRIDLTLTSNGEDVLNKIRNQGTVVNDGKPIVLYSPTWKGKSVHKATDDIEQIKTEFFRLVEKFENQYNILIKVHPFIYRKFKEEADIQDYLVSDLMDPNEVLSVTDILITDYSSIFFDFLVTEKPIIFYSWDRDLYHFERGMYLNEDELPGPVTENIEELISALETVDQITSEYKEKYKSLANRMVKYDDGHATERYVDYIFNNNHSSEKLVIKDISSDKKKLLMYPGGMMNNGITSSLLNLVNNIDYTKYDVTIITNSTNNREINNNLNSLNDNARVLFRFGTDILTKEERKINLKLAKEGLIGDNKELYPEVGYRREMNRLVANQKYDVSIDFSGYSYFWGRYMLSADAKRHVVFMHSDLLADSMREINGKTPMREGLHGLFTLYYKFDKLLSVSPATRDVNKSKLREYVKDEQMSYVYNSININQILDTKEVAEEKTVTLKPVRVQRRVEETGPVCVFKNIEVIDKEEFVEVTLDSEDKIVQLAQYIDAKEREYAKISVNNVYLGWVNRDYLSNEPLEILTIEDYHGYGTVAANLNDPIWKNIKTNTDKDEILTRARYFKNRYLEFDKVAKTPKGRYFHVNYLGKELGWVSPRVLRRQHKLSKLSPLNSYFLYRMKKQESLDELVYTDKIELVTLYGEFNPSLKLSLWTAPEGTFGAKEMLDSNEYAKEIFKVVEKIIINDVVYCKLCFDTGRFMGYVKEELIHYMSDIEYKEEMARRKELQGPYKLPRKDLANQKIPTLDKSMNNFVNMGRLSPEKNQLKLIEAFSHFVKDEPNSRLYILGKGPLVGDLIEGIKEYKMEGKVYLLGHISNPFSFMKELDYFVLPSYYEGQPMVLLEALTIELKIVASNIPANVNVIGQDEEYGLLTEGTEVSQIYSGLKRIVENEIEFKKFEYKEYNKQAMTTFYEGIFE